MMGFVCVMVKVTVSGYLFVIKGEHMSLVSLIVVLVVLGVIMYMVNKYIPMESNIKNILNVAVVVFLLLWLLQAFGLLSGLENIRIGK